MESIYRDLVNPALARDDQAMERALPQELSGLMEKYPHLSYEKTEIIMHASIDRLRTGPEQVLLEDKSPRLKVFVRLDGEYTYGVAVAWSEYGIVFCQYYGPRLN